MEPWRRAPDVYARMGIFDTHFACPECGAVRKKRCYPLEPIYSRCAACGHWGVLFPCYPEYAVQIKCRVSGPLDSEQILVFDIDPREC